MKSMPSNSEASRGDDERSESTRRSPDDRCEANGVRHAAPAVPKLDRRDFIRSGSAFAAAAATFSVPKFVRAKPADAHDIVRLDVTAGIEALKSGRLSSSDYCEAALTQLRRFEANNIFTQVSYDYVRSHAGSVDSRRRDGKAIGALQGLPYALKDSVDMVEYFTIAGHPALMEFRPTIDADLVTVIRGADGVCIGKTQIPPLSLWWTTENPMTGDTGNPFNRRYKTGGSSGGSGAAVGAQHRTLRYRRGHRRLGGESRLR